MPNPRTLPAWQQLAAIKPVALPESAITPIEACGLYVDFARHAIDVKTRDILISLAREAGVIAKRDAMFAGEAINITENRPVLHAALRSRETTPLMVNGEDVRVGIRREFARVEKFTDAVRSGKIRGASDKKFTDVVNLGIGGSLLGPQFVCAALSRFADGPHVHFVSNVDGAHLEETLAKLDPSTTLFTLTSKTFTTDETLTNSRSAQAWIAAKLGDDAFAKHFVAITAAPVKAKDAGYSADNIFEFSDWVGGRFSVWATVGLPIALACGFAQFRAFLDGADEMDQHFRDAPMEKNLPMMLALVGIWNRNFLGLASHAVLPYAERLNLFSQHLQQLEMESNGKSVDLDGNRVDYLTCPVIFGQAGTNGQHSFHQLLHQGTDRISSDIVLVAKAESHLKSHHDKLLANALAQADAFWRGKSFDAAYAELASKIPDEKQRRIMAEHRVHPGQRPVTLIMMPLLDAKHLGALIALYEHKVLVQGAIWNVNPFDQWGVELGKVIAQTLVSHLDINAKNNANVPAQMATIIEKLNAARRAN
jgi:glucose-6-phosphate isomerase